MAADTGPVDGTTGPISPPVTPGSPRVQSRRFAEDRRGKDGRSAEARRVKSLHAGYLAALGKPTDVPTLALVRAAAEAVVIAEMARGAYLAGRGDINSVVRAENTANRALKRLGVAKPAKPAKGKGIAEKVAELNAARRAADATEAASTLEAKP